MEKLTVGQKLWFVSSRGFGPEREATVVKVGRKWAELDIRCRIDLQTLVADGGDYSSPGQCWRSRAEYEEAARLDVVWSRLRRAIDKKYRVPSGVTAADIEQAAILLGVDVSEATS